MTDTETNADMIDAIDSADAKADSDVTQLSNRDIKWRAKYKLTVDELETTKASAAKELETITERTTQIEKAKMNAEQKWVEAEVKAEAIAAGIKDVDFIKLIDLSTLKTTDDGKIEGLKEVVQAFKASKPGCFGSEAKLTSSSSNAAVPNTPVTPVTKSAWDYSPAEYAAKRSRFMSGRFD